MKKILQLLQANQIKVIIETKNDDNLEIRMQKGNKNFLMHTVSTKIHPQMLDDCQDVHLEEMLTIQINKLLKEVNQ